MTENWAVYPPVSVPGAGTWLPEMPDEAALIKAIEAALDRAAR
jgi:hypothetical protein